MRVISQNGIYDTPYETMQLWFCQNDNGSYRIRGNMPADEAITLAVYSSKEKALKAMESLRKAYSDYVVATATNAGLGNVFITGDKVACTRAEFSIKMFGKCTDFQFPQDDEV